MVPYWTGITVVNSITYATNKPKTIRYLRIA